MIIDPSPKIPIANARSLVKDTYLKWSSDRTAIQCIVLMKTNGEFSHKFEKAQPDVILQRLKEYFSMLDDVECYRVSCTIYNAKMLNGGSVTNHVLYMIEMIEWLDRLGCPLHK